MSVIDVWGLVSGKVVGLITRNADEWYFDLPSDSSGTLMAEFWAQDEAGNTGHAVALLQLTDGGLKCIRILRTHGECRMRDIHRPECVMSDRPALCSMRPMQCSRMEV